MFESQLFHYYKYVLPQKSIEEVSDDVEEWAAKNEEEIQLLRRNEQFRKEFLHAPLRKAAAACVQHGLREHLRHQPHRRLDGGGPRAARRPSSSSRRPDSAAPMRRAGAGNNLNDICLWISI